VARQRRRGWQARAGGPALELTERWLVRRPQPIASPALLAADDAIRSQSVHSVAGSGIALQLLLLSALAAALASSDDPFLRSTMWLPAVFGVGLAWASCLYYGHRAWRVQRPPVVVAPR